MYTLRDFEGKVGEIDSKLQQATQTKYGFKFKWELVFEDYFTAVHSYLGDTAMVCLLCSKSIHKYS